MVHSNVVEKESLRRIQVETMDILTKALANSFGPFGSNSIIDMDKGLPRYSKDGHTILSRIQFSDPIARSVQSDIEEETRTQAVKIGDSTTSITLLSAFIFKALAKYEENHSEKTPRSIVEDFKKITSMIADRIKAHGREATIEDMRKIALISTNGNEKLADILNDVYTEFGKDVYIDVLASLNGNTYLKELNGMTIECGFFDPTLINDNVKNTVTTRDPEIYAFKDPIDTIEMGRFFDVIIKNNIADPFMNKQPDKIVPTVIIAPRISRDYSAFIDSVMGLMAQIPPANRGFLNIITNVTPTDMDQFEDICDLCGCKYIKKYIDPQIQARDIEQGLAPTPETVFSFAGTAEAVVSDAHKTSFITPAKMYNEDGTTSDLFNQRVEYLEGEIEKLATEGDNTTENYNLKKRLHSLRGRMVEIYIGGVTVADRDAERDLMEDAVLNCRSAAVSGVGYAANYEGLVAANSLVNTTHPGEINEEILDIIVDGYKYLARLLYASCGLNDDEIESTITKTIIKGAPFNVVTREIDHDVLSSIDTDVCIIETISKIITIMATANQFLLTTINMNKY